MDSFRTTSPTPSVQAADLLTRWKEVRLGLHLVLMGHFLILSLAVPGFILIGICFAQPGLWMVDIGVRLKRTDAMTLGNWMLMLGALPGYGFLLMGQWRCLGYAPARHGARAFLYFSVLCLLLGPTCLIGAQYLGKAGSLLTLEGLSTAAPQTVFTAPALLQFAGAMLLLASVAMLSLFQRAAHKSLSPDRSRLALIVFCWFVSFLVGATIGLFWYSTLEVVGGLAAGWVLSLLWHVVLIGRTSAAIAQARLPRPGPRVENYRSKPYSGVRRYYVPTKPQ